MTDREQFEAMLDRAGLGYGLRDDTNAHPDYMPVGWAVQVEDPGATGDGNDEGPTIDFHFDVEGRLVGVSFPDA